MLDEPSGTTESGQQADEQKVSGSTGSNSQIQKLDLVTPQGQGETIQVPPLDEIETLWNSNLELGSRAEGVIGDTSLATLQQLARSELLELATQYSCQYGDFERPIQNAPIVMAGHQPELFHPGVWYKNFVLSRLGQRLNATPINLIVDNDVCANAAISIPRILGGKPSISRVPFDDPGYDVPYEERLITDAATFESFANRAANAIGPFVENPLVRPLWQQVLQASAAIEGPGADRIGAAIAAGRHRLEATLGLKTLEIPISQLADSRSFATFASHVFQHLKHFQTIYNSSLQAYREVYKIRSKSHPVPELENTEGWIETPFWVWREDSPFRKRLFALTAGGQIRLSDLAGWQVELEVATAVDGLCELSQAGVKIRPRALATTMYSRLVLSDLFIHGIGGAKYDQLTDLIASRFFNVALPGFCTISATLRLPIDVPQTTPSDRVKVQAALRELKFHPERGLDADEISAAAPLVSEKQKWIDDVHPDSRKQRHDAIAACNQHLQRFVDSEKRALEARLANISGEIRANQVLGSREFSFCLQPEDESVFRDWALPVF